MNNTVEKIKWIGIVISLIIAFLFTVATLCILMLCALFGNLFGFIAIAILSVLLAINAYIYYREREDLWN